jgi:hypothetical protein
MRLCGCKEAVEGVHLLRLSRLDQSEVCGLIQWKPSSLRTAAMAAALSNPNALTPGRRFLRMSFGRRPSRRSSAPFHSPPRQYDRLELVGP